MNGKILALVAILALGAAAATSSGGKTDPKPNPNPDPKPVPAPQPTKPVPAMAYQRPGWWVDFDLADAELYDPMAAIEYADKWATSLPKYLPPKDLDDLVWREALNQKDVKPSEWPMYPPDGILVLKIPQLDKNTGGVPWAVGVLLLQALLRAGRITPADATALYNARRAEYTKRGYPVFAPEKLA